MQLRLIECEHKFIIPTDEGREARIKLKCLYCHYEKEHMTRRGYFKHHDNIDGDMRLMGGENTWLTKLSVSGIVD